MNDDPLAPWRAALACNFPQVQEIFPDCLQEARALLTDSGVQAWLEGASLVCKIGRGYEPVLNYLEEMPQLAQRMGEEALPLVAKTVWDMSRTPNGGAIPAFLQAMGEVGRRLGSLDLLRRYLDLVRDFMERTTGSIHGFHATIPSPGLPLFFAHLPYLLSQLSCEGLRNWVDYGIRNYTRNPDRQRDYFAIQSADSRAVLQRERHGTLLADHERQLDLYLKAIWAQKSHFVPYSEGFHQLRKPMPYYDSLGIRLPDVYDDRNGIPGINRYRALLAHIAAHQHWSSQIFADNFSPFQRIAIEIFEDCRVELLAIEQWPGLRPLWLSLHPKPAEDACDPEKESCIRHRLAMFSRAMLDPQHSYQNPDLLEFVTRFHAHMAEGKTSTESIAKLAILFIARTRRQQDLATNVHFTDTEVDYRDDNRHLWKFIEESDEEEMFDAEQKSRRSEEELEGLPPRHYPEWDYHSKTYHPDWVSLYESLHPAGAASEIDQLLSKHEALAKRIKKLLDLLKPQQAVRIRYQEEGTELDLDVAIRSLIDFRSGANPDPRINMSHRTDGRNIAVMLLLDLSESLNQSAPGSEQTVLQLSQEAVALLAWSIEHLGDEFAIAGFSSNTRHEVRYQHIKGYGEHWNDTVKSRLAAMDAHWSTRMGAAMRHAGHYLGARNADKKLMLVLTDGEPADIDVEDPRHLIEDSRKAVQELERDGIFTYCINLDPKADEYVADIFGKNYLVIDNVQRLPERLPQLFLSLTR